MIKKIIQEKIYNIFNKTFEGVSIDISDVDIVDSKKVEHGDYATNISMKYAKKLNMNPLQIAEKISNQLKSDTETFFDDVVYIKPGFINFKINSLIFNRILKDIYKNRERYGSGIKKNDKLIVEYVSANPTGYLHLGHLRNAAVGDSVCRILKFYGFDVQSEYYINDYGNQIKMLGKSLEVRVKNLMGENIEMPEDGYQGEYLLKVAEDFLLAFPDTTSLKSNNFEEFAKDYLLEEIKKDLKSLNIDFDNWYSEKEKIHETGLLEKTLNKLDNLNAIYDKDDARWIKTSEFGDADDWVLIKSDKSSTYFLSDIAYHEDKVNRGFDRIINIWGADHHSHVSRLKASMKSLGNSQTHFDFLMIQFVRLLKDGKDISMSKRSGQYTTIKDLLSLVNKDVVRFMMVTRSSDTHFDFDLNQCLQDSDENPVFYIQYANARINSIIKKSGVSELDINKMDIIESDKEIKLIKEIIGFEDAIKDSAQSLSPHKLTFYLQNLAKEFHSYYKSTKILNENQDQVMSRLVLITTIKFILSNGLQLLGASSPEEM
tara:strand:- start:3291 stop:4922 length:1632 start_codon:yes stop_codon:yes gene_type:complete